MDTRLLNGTLEMLVLEVTRAQPTYGYQITQEVLRRTQGVFALKEGSLYPALHRLERNGMLTAEWSEAEARPRKYYRITAEGEAALQARRAEWQQFSGSVNAVLGLDAHGLA